MKLEKKIKTIFDIPIQEYVAPGGIFCQGCGAILAARLILKLLGERTVVVNAAGCFTLAVVYPYTVFKASWLYTAMACAPAGAQGIRDALDILIEKRKIDKNEDLNILVVTGDGAASSIGLQSTITAIHRNLDFWYLAYDNQAFMNTGAQKTETTPFGAATSTTKPTSLSPLGTEQEPLDLFSVWVSAGAPYVATVSPSYPVDFLDKVERAKEIKGPKLFHCLSGCPPGWNYEPALTIKVGRLAVESGVWALKEAVNGTIKHTYIPKKRIPVEEYLKIQGRFEHLFKPVKNKEAIEEIQRKVDKYWEYELHDAK
ncbi:MAG: thiamine pyrophosphate-dependent enzyme [Thermoproteota archaeon]|nr:pyruvate synthase [Candidatus Brockarchaeota archaeon]MBO3801725.1 pyruvate synthase [Candidatus Brockarchaeota archaeon]